MRLHEVDGPVYLDRQLRMQRVLRRLHERADDGQPIVVADLVADIRAIQSEVEPIPLAPGQSYRWRMLHLDPANVHHHHYDTAKGVIALDVPDVDSGEWMELEGTFIARQAMPESGTADMLIFGMPDGAVLGFGELDILWIEDVD